MEFEASLDEVLSAAVDLIDVASTETEMLRVLRPQDLQPLMERKQAIANYYHNLIKKLERRRDVFAALPERRKDEVRETSDWVKLILMENARLLRASVDANERLLLAIRRAAEQKYGTPAPTYTHTGHMQGQPSGDSGVKVSLGVNETT